MIKEPFYNYSKGFYIWFNKDLKKEYYVTPLYFYYADRKKQDKEYTVKLKKDISKVKGKEKDVTKALTTIDEPYVEKFGMFLINFLNADFSNFKSAYNTFFYAYGFEFLNEYGELKTQYNNESEYIDEAELFYSKCLYRLKEWQNQYRECVDYIYNLNGKNEDVQSKYKSKFIAYMIKSNDLYSDSKDMDVVLDNFIEKHQRYGKEDLTTLINLVEANEGFLKLNNIYIGNTLKSICFLVLNELVEDENTKIKVCQNCKRYFIPTNRQAEVYCDLPNLDGAATCREKGAGATYKKNLENYDGLLEYRRSYQKKLMEVSRNKKDNKLKESFDAWKKKAQKKVKEFKQNKITDDELYNWMLENK